VVSSSKETFSLIDIFSFLDKGSGITKVGILGSYTECIFELTIDDSPDPIFLGFNGLGDELQEETDILLAWIF